MPPTPFEQPVYITKPILPPFDSYVDYVRGIWDRSRLTNDGPLHLDLEAALSQYLHVNHVALTSNGTMALLLACKALDLAGEVITTPFTFPATPEVLTWANVTPVFADIDSETLTLDPAAVTRAINPNTSGILGVHVYGVPCDVQALADIGRRYNLKLLYDAAHAFGTEIDGRSVLQFGNATAMSFHATKLFHTAEGGAVVTQDADVDERVKLLRNFGIVDEVSVLVPGINGKLNELQAALGLANLKIVAAERSKRRAIAAIYRGRLGGIDGFRCVTPPANVSTSDQYFAFRIDSRVANLSRDELNEAMKTYNVFARRYFYPLCSELPFYRGLPSSTPENLPVAHEVARQILCLPFYGALGVDGANRICDIIEYVSTVRKPQAAAMPTPSGAA